MQNAIVLIGWVTTQGPQIAAALVAVLTATIGLCMLIPGDQPEKALQRAVDFIKKFSAK